MSRGEALKKKSKVDGARKRFRNKLLLLAGSVFFSLLMVELSLRIIGFSDPSLFYLYDHERGVALRPLAEGWWNQEGKSYVRINSQGLRDREHTFVKPPGTLRIAVLGDSYAEALQVPQEEAFWAEMERRLQGCPNIGGRKLEVLNFGVSGYSTTQELITLREHVWKYSPDIVLLAFTTGNDLDDNLKELSHGTTRPYFVYRDGKLTLDTSMLDAKEASRRFRLTNSAMGRAFDWFRLRLRVLQLVTSVGRALANKDLAQPPHAAAVLKEEPGPKQTPVKEGANSKPEVPPLAEAGLEGRVYYEPASESWKEAWRVTEGLISLMHTEVKSRGAKFGLVTLSSPAQVQPNPRVYQGLLRERGLKDLFYPEHRLRALGEREGFPVLNLAPLLKDYAEKHGVYLHGFGKSREGHWNQTGHHAAGDMIADWLCADATP